MRIIEGVRNYPMHGSGLLALIFFGLITVASAQQDPSPPASDQQNTRTIERTVGVESGKVSRIGAYVNIKPDCTSGPLPILRLAEAPHGGRVVIKRAKIRVTNAGACLSAEVPGLVAFYQPRPDFSGADKVAIEVKFPDSDRVNMQKITINVRPAATNL